MFKTLFLIAFTSIGLCFLCSTSDAAGRKITTKERSNLSNREGYQIIDENIRSGTKKGTKLELVTETPKLAIRSPFAQHLVHSKPPNTKLSNVHSMKSPYKTGYKKDMGGTKQELAKKTIEKASNSPDNQHSVHPKLFDTKWLNVHNKNNLNEDGYHKDREGAKLERVNGIPEQANRTPDSKYSVHPKPSDNKLSNVHNKENPNKNHKDMEGTKLERVNWTPDQAIRTPDSKHSVHPKPSDNKLSNVHNKENSNKNHKDMEGTKPERLNGTSEQACKNHDNQHSLHPKPSNNKSSNVHSKKRPSKTGYEKNLEGSKLE